MSKCPDLIGFRSGKLTVIKKLKGNKHKEMEWLCLCDCGNEHISSSNRLTRHITTCCKSCAMEKISHSNRTHGCEPRRLYGIYTNMKTRCYNSNYVLFSRYGGRGISICDEWLKSYESFRDWAFNNGYSERLTIERVDNDGNYCPENCKWVDRTAQANNRHTNRILTLNGESDTMANWSRRLNIPYHIIQGRLEKNWDDEKALTTPWNGKKK